MSWFKRKGASERGAVSLEMALVLPILLLMIVGVSAIGHATLVRFLLNSAAYDAARACAMDRTMSTSVCATKVVNAKLGPTKKWCSPLTTSLNPAPQKISGLWDVWTLSVEVKCGYGTPVGKGYLKTQGIVFGTLTARAAMPF